MPHFLDPGETSWSLSKRDPHAIPNARIALALLRVTRRLKGAFPEHSFDDLGKALAPALRRVPERLRSVLESRTDASESPASVFDAVTWCPSVEDCTRLGQGLARGVPALRPLADAIEVVLERLVRTTSHPSDKNVDILQLTGQLR